MAKLGTLVQKVRSKNAGPFWLTIDIFCGTSQAYGTLVAALETDQVAQIYDVDMTTIKRFDIPALNVVKFSFPRPAIQGAATDRDMHGASWASLLAETELDLEQF